MATAEIRDEEDGTFCAFNSSTGNSTRRTCCAPLTALRRPIEVEDLFDMGYYGCGSGSSGGAGLTAPFWVWPLFGPLLFENQTSDARDHCANERTFLSYLRLSIYMAIVSVAIVLSFHLKSQPSEAELAMATPLGVIFWLLSVACLLVGLGNYIQTINMYSRKAAIVQTGLKTQVIMGVVSLAIIATCVTLLVVNRLSESADTA